MGGRLQLTPSVKVRARQGKPETPGHIPDSGWKRRTRPCRPRTPQSLRGHSSPSEPASLCAGRSCREPHDGSPHGGHPTLPQRPATKASVTRMGRVGPGWKERERSKQAPAGAGPGGVWGPDPGPSRSPEAGTVDLEALSRHTGPNPLASSALGRVVAPWSTVDMPTRPWQAGEGKERPRVGCGTKSCPSLCSPVDKGPGHASARTHCSMSYPQPSPKETYSTLGIETVETL